MEDDDDDDIYLDVTMFEEENEGIVDLETAMLAPDLEDEDPFYFVRARATGEWCCHGQCPPPRHGCFMACNGSNC